MANLSTELADGFVCIPVITSCNDVGLFHLENAHDLTVSELASRLGVKGGYLAVCLRLLVSLGWVHSSYRKLKVSSGQTLREKIYTITPECKEKASAIPSGLTDLLHIDLVKLFSSETTNQAKSKDDITRLDVHASKFNKIVTSTINMARSTDDNLLSQLVSGFVLAIVLVSLHQAGRLVGIKGGNIDQNGNRLKKSQVQQILASIGITNHEQYGSIISLMHVHPDCRDPLFNFFHVRGWITTPGSTPSSFNPPYFHMHLTDIGRFIFERALIVGTTVSYRYMFGRLSDLLHHGPSIFDDSNVSRADEIPQSPSALSAAIGTESEGHDKEERHINRTLNVLGSGFQHKKFFADVDNIIQAVFDRSQLEHQPSYIVDMGCGDGELLKRVYSVIQHSTMRGKHLETYPIYLVGADFNQAALEATRINLQGLPVLLLNGDIGDPEQLHKDMMAKFNIKSVDEVLHIRSFLDHDRPFIPAKSSSLSRQHVPYHGVHVTNEGHLIPVHDCIQSLLEHMHRWKKIVSDHHGLILLEVHCLPELAVKKYLGSCESLHFDAYHGLSGQLLVTAVTFVLTAAEAGLFPILSEARVYPRLQPFTRITLNRYVSRPYRIRMATQSDLPFLLDLEKLCWPQLSMQASKEDLSARIEQYPAGQLVLEEYISDSGTTSSVCNDPIRDSKFELVAVIYSQRINGADVLFDIEYNEISSLHGDGYAHLQLLGLNVNPDKRHQNYGRILLNFFLYLNSLDPATKDVLGVTRCGDYIRHKALYRSYAHYAAERHPHSPLPKDPILRFHVSNGAQMMRILNGYRLSDVDNEGNGILIRYNLQRRLEYHRQVQHVSHISPSQAHSVLADDNFGANCAAITNSSSSSSSSSSLSSSNVSSRRGSSASSLSDLDAELPSGMYHAIPSLDELLSGHQHDVGDTKKASPLADARSFSSRRTTDPRQAGLEPPHFSLETVLNTIVDTICEAKTLQQHPSTYQDETFTSLGLDSMDLLDLQLVLSSNFNCNLHPTVFFQFPTPSALALYIAQSCDLQPISNSKTHATRTKESNGRSNTDETPSETDATGNSPNQYNLFQNAAETLITGMAGRFPLSTSVHEFWSRILAGNNMVSPKPPGLRSRPTSSLPKEFESGGYVYDAAGFDRTFFNVSASESINMDPQQRLLLMVVAHALEDAMIPLSSLRGKQVAVFVGAFSHDYEWISLCQQQQLNPSDNEQGAVLGNMHGFSAYFSTANSSSVLAGRISYLFDFRGPAVCVHTACSSSLVAAHLARQSLLRGECEVAIVCGVNLMLTDVLSQVFGQAGMLSSQGTCRTFASGCDGYVRAETCAALVLQRSDSPNIHVEPYACLKGTALNQDGRSNGLTAPNPDAQAAVIRAALSDAGMAIDDIDYVECHGTGTPIGDAIEVQGLNTVFQLRKKPLPIGSVKTNMGHAEAASGLASLCKAALIVRERQVPAHLHCMNKNPLLTLHTVPLVITDTTLTLPASDLQSNITVGVSCYGYSGTNAHAIVSSYGLDKVSYPGSRMAFLEKSELGHVARRCYQTVQPLSAPTHVAVPISAHHTSSVFEAMAAHTHQLKDVTSNSYDLTMFAMSSVLGRDHEMRYCLLLLLDTRLPRETVVDELYSAGCQLKTFVSMKPGNEIPKAFELAQSPCYKNLMLPLDPEDNCVYFAKTAGVVVPTHTSSMRVMIPDVPVNEWPSSFTCADICNPALSSCLSSPIPSELEDWIDSSLPNVYRLCCHLISHIPQTTISSQSPLSEQLKEGQYFSQSKNDSGNQSQESMSFIVSSIDHAMVCLFALHALKFEEIITYFTTSMNLDDRKAYFATCFGIFGISSDVLFEIIVIPGKLTTMKTISGPYSPWQFCLSFARKTFVYDLREQSHMQAILARQLALSSSTETAMVEANAIFWQEMDKSGVPVKALPRLPLYPFQLQPYWIPQNAELILMGLKKEVSSFAEDHVIMEQHLVPGAGFVASVFGGVCSLLFNAVNCGVLEVSDVNLFHSITEDDIANTLLRLYPDGSYSIDIETNGSKHICDAKWRIVSEWSTINCPWLHAALNFPDEGLAVTEITVKSSDLFYSNLAKLNMHYFGPLRAFEGSIRFHENLLVAHGRIPVSRIATMQPVHAITQFLDAGLQLCVDLTQIDLKNQSSSDFTTYSFMPVAFGRVFMITSMKYALVDVPHVDVFSGMSQTVNSTHFGQGSKPKVSVWVVVKAGSTIILAAERVQIQVFRNLASLNSTEATLGHLTCMVTSSVETELLSRPCAFRATEVKLLTLGSKDNDTIAHRKVKVDKKIPTGILHIVMNNLDRQSGCVLAEDLLSAQDSVIFVPLNAESLHSYIVQQVASLSTSFSTIFIHISADMLDIQFSSKSLSSSGPPSPIDFYWKLIQVVQASRTALSNNATSLQTDRNQVVFCLAQLGQFSKEIWGACKALARVIWSERLFSKCMVVLVNAFETCLQDLHKLLRDVNEMEEIEPLLMIRQDASIRESTWLCEQYTRVSDIQPIYSWCYTEPKERNASLQDLEPTALGWNGTCPTDSVIVQTRAISLNFRDVLLVLGLYPGPPMPPCRDFAGVVVAVGRNVPVTFAIGDFVFGTKSGCLASHVFAHPSQLCHVPEGWTLSQCAAAVSVEITITKSIENVIDSFPENSYALIHAGAGGVGLAAIQRLVRHGVRIFATAGSPTKRNYLKSLSGVIYVSSSRDINAFKQDVSSFKNQFGHVNLVINSLSGEFTRVSLDLLGENGVFVELGKRNILSEEEVNKLWPHVDYRILAVDSIIDDDMDACNIVMQQLRSQMKSNRVSPLPIKTFPLTPPGVRDAFGYMRRAEHIGKIVLTSPEQIDNQSDLPSKRGVYVVSGGLGALGLQTAAWLLCRGVVHV
eukprot:gene1227-4437_t